MKPPIFLLPALCATLLLPACKQPPSKPSADTKPAASTPAVITASEAPVTLDPDKLLQAFGSSGPEEQSRLGKAAQAIRADNYDAALEVFEHLLQQGHMNPEQTALVTSYVTQLKKLKQDKR